MMLSEYLLITLNFGASKKAPTFTFYNIQIRAVIYVRPLS